MTFHKVCRRCGKDFWDRTRFRCVNCLLERVSLLQRVIDRDKARNAS